MATANRIRVWDPLVRIFHWTLAAAFFIAFISEGEPETLHVVLGYLIVGLLVVRLVWGLVGSEHARFRDFVRSPRTVWQYTKDNIAGRARRYIGHNPLGGVMVIALMLSVTMTAFSGMSLLAAEEGEGPLAGWLIAAPPAGQHEESALAEQTEEVHEFFANFTLFLVMLHVLGVVVESVRHRENLARAMITGYKRE